MHCPLPVSPSGFIFVSSLVDVIDKKSELEHFRVHILICFSPHLKSGVGGWSGTYIHVCNLCFLGLLLLFRYVAPSASSRILRHMSLSLDSYIFLLQDPQHRYGNLGSGKRTGANFWHVCLTVSLYICICRVVTIKLFPCFTHLHKVTSVLQYSPY